MDRNALVPGTADEQNLIRLMDTYSNLLLGLCIIILRDYHLAQDVVQETFLRAWKHGQLREDTEKSWLVRVAVNLCRDQHRSRWMRHTDRSVTPEELVIPVLPEENDVIREVKHLPRQEREVIVMHYWGNLSADEIAEALHIGRASVYRRLDKARQRLRIELDENEHRASCPTQERRCGI